MIPILDEKRCDLVDLCRRFRVTRLDVFGSAASGTFRTESSDLDFIAHFDGTRDGDYAERFYHFAEALEQLFGRPIDLLTEGMVRNPYFREAVEETRQNVVDLADNTAFSIEGHRHEGTYREWSDAGWRSFALDQFLRDAQDDDVEYSLGDAQEIYRR